jgi:Putative prokaryotic signal transducing protein
MARWCPMRRLTHAPNIALAALWADMLRQAGIEASVQRYFAGGIAGEIPPDQALPEIWVLDDAQLERARHVLHEMRHPAWRHWVCRACGESVDGPFEQCWNCGAAMPA